MMLMMAKRMCNGEAMSKRGEEEADDEGDEVKSDENLEWPPWKKEEGKWTGVPARPEPEPLKGDCVASQRK